MFTGAPESVRNRTVWSWSRWVVCGVAYWIRRRLAEDTEPSQEVRLRPRMTGICAVKWANAAPPAEVSVGLAGQAVG